jgi:pimeloyl-ACP methyl ester carboxylesterase
MKSAPNASGAGSAWAPNLPAAICAAFGVGEPAGTLPVNLPALDSDFRLSSDILYARGTDEFNPDAALKLPPDYTDASAWVALPETLRHDADTFFILPTVNMKNTEPGNEDIYNGRDASRFVKTFGMEKGIVEESTNVYAPYYRQSTIGCLMDEDGMIPSDWPRAAKSPEYEDLAYSDIRAAWLHYLDNWNDGRPVVLFGFSQGAQMALRLLTEFGADGALSDRLVAAYVIGMPIDESCLAGRPWLHMAQGEDDTGVIISFSAMDERADIAPVRQYAINPLNWRTDSTPASKEENLGFVTADTWGKITEEIPAYCGAYLDPDSGELVVTDGEALDELYEASGTLFPAGDYHLYDLNFFYRNLQKNIADRIESFIASHTEEPANAS